MQPEILAVFDTIPDNPAAIARVPAILHEALGRFLLTGVRGVCILQNKKFWRSIIMYNKKQLATISAIAFCCGVAGSVAGSMVTKHFLPAAKKMLDQCSDATVSQTAAQKPAPTLKAP